MKIQRLPGFIIIRLEDDANGAVFGLADVTVSARNVLVTEELSAVDVLARHTALLADFQTQLTRMADRQTQVETWAAQHGYTAAGNDSTGNQTAE